MKKYRYCKSCGNGTIQHSDKRLVREVRESVLDRFLMGVCTLGFNELLLDKYWKEPL